jgi:uncharacterized membrane protein
MIVILVIILILIAIILAVFYTVPSKIEGYHTPLHYNKQLTPDIDNYKRLTLMPRSPTYRDY